MHANARQCPQVDTSHGKNQAAGCGAPKPAQSRSRVPACSGKQLRKTQAPEGLALRHVWSPNPRLAQATSSQQCALPTVRGRESRQDAGRRARRFFERSHRPQWMARARGGVPAAPQRRDMLRLPNDQTSTKSTHFRGTFVAFVREPRRARNAESAAPQSRNRRFGLFCSIMICRCALWVRTSATFPVGHRVYGRGTH